MMRNSVIYLIMSLLVISEGAVAKTAGGSPKTAAPAASPAPPAVSESETGPVVAVYVTGNAPEHMKTSLSERLLTALVDGGGAAVNDKNNAAFLAAIGKESKKRNDALDDSLICELARKFGIRYIGVANITHEPGEFKLSARVMSAKTGSSRFDAEVSGLLIKTEEINRAAGILIEKMFGGNRIFGGQTTSEHAQPDQPAQTPPPAADAAPPMPETAAAAKEGEIAPQTTIADSIANTAETVTASNDEIAVLQSTAVVDFDTAEPLSVPVGAQAPPLEPTAAPAAKKTNSRPRKQHIDVSSGVGGVIEAGFGGGVTYSDSGRIKMPYTAVGAYLYLDATFAEIFVCYSAGNGQWVGGDKVDTKNQPYMSRTYVGAGLFAKYPFDVYDRVKLFPLFGLDYETSISGKVKSGGLFDGTDDNPEANALSSRWYKFGGGVDFDMGQTIYLRAEFTYGLRAAKAYEKSHEPDAHAESGSGIAVKIGIGAMF